MAIRVACPACQSQYDIEESFRGKQVVCSQCNQRFQIGGVPQVELAAEPSAAGDMAAPDVAPPKKKTPLIAWFVMGGTFLLVAGVVVFVLIYLILTLNTENDKPQARKPVTTELRHTAPGEGFGPLVDDPQAEKPANYETPSLSPSGDGLYHFHLQVLAPMEDSRGVKAPETDMTSEVKQRVKRATVMIIREHEDTAGSGTGFFCFEPGLVVTNAHVVGMMNPTTREPKRLDVIVYSNQPDEMRLKAKVLYVDRRMDLALLSVPKSNKLPEPLSLVSSETLEDLQRVAVVGFPFGEELGKDVTMSATSISSLRRDTKSRSLREVQVNGGMNPGNSGGPVVDSLGRVIGIAVRMKPDRTFGELRNTGINFAVPSDYAYHIARGHLTELTLFPPVQTGSAQQLPVRAFAVDPQGKIKAVSAECWTGPVGPNRAGSHAPPAKAKGDSERARQALKFVDGRVEGSVALPPCPSGQAYWIQLEIEGKDGKKCWTSAHCFKADAKNAMRNVPWNPQPASRASGPADLAASFDGGMNAQGGGLPVTMHLLNVWEENDTSPRKQKRLEIGLRLMNEAVPHKYVAQMVSGRGQAAGADDTNNLTALGKFYHQALHDTMDKTVRGLEPVLPEKPLQPNESWTQEADFPLESLLVASSAPQMRFQHTYLGQTQHQGRPHAVIAIAGDRTPDKKATENKTRVRLTGVALVDVASRRVSYLYAASESETSGNPAGVVARGGGELVALTGQSEYRLNRKLSSSD